LQRLNFTQEAQRQMPGKVLTTTTGTRITFVSDSGNRDGQLQARVLAVASLFLCGRLARPGRPSRRTSRYRPRR